MSTSPRETEVAEQLLVAWQKLLAQDGLYDPAEELAAGWTFGQSTFGLLAGLAALVGVSLSVVGWHVTCALFANTGLDPWNAAAISDLPTVALKAIGAVFAMVSVIVTLVLGLGLTHSRLRRVRLFRKELRSIPARGFWAILLLTLVSLIIDAGLLLVYGMVIVTIAVPMSKLSDATAVAQVRAMMNRPPQSIHLTSENEPIKATILGPFDGGYLVKAAVTGTVRLIPSGRVQEIEATSDGKPGPTPPL